MDVALHASTLTLARDRLIALRNADGTVVRCLDGSLWITEGRGSEDVILGPGESFAISGAGLTLVTALDHARFRLCEPRPAAAGLFDVVRAWLARHLGAHAA